MTDKYKLVSFAQKKGYQIDDPDFIKYLKDKINNKYHLNLKTGNKYYKFLEEKDFPVLNKYPHLVCFNLNQKPTYLYLTTYQDQKFCIYFDAELSQFTTVKHRFSSELYQDTLLEGELVKVSQQHYIYLLSDLLVWRHRVNQDPLDQKMETLQNMISKNYKSDPGFDPCQILVKDFVEYQYLDSFFNDYLTTVSYQQYVSGLIFRPMVKSNRNIIVVLNKRDFHRFTVPDQYETSLLAPKPKKSPASSVSSLVQMVQDQKKQYNKSVSPKKTPSPLPVATADPMGSIEDATTSPTVSSIVSATVATVATVTASSPKKKLKIDYKRFKEVNFEIRKTSKPDVYELWLFNEDNQSYKYGIASIPTRQCSEMVKTWFADREESVESNSNDDPQDQSEEPIIVSCQYIKSFSKWKPIEMSKSKEADNISKLMKVKK